MATANSTIEVPSSIALPGGRVAVTVVVGDQAALAIQAMASAQGQSFAEYFQQQVEHGIEGRLFY